MTAVSLGNKLFLEFLQKLDCVKPNLILDQILKFILHIQMYII